MPKPQTIRNTFSPFRAAHVEILSISHCPSAHRKTSTLDDKHVARESFSPGRRESQVTVRDERTTIVVSHASQ